MHPYEHARADPDRLAFALIDTDETLTYGQLDVGSNQVAHLFRRHGLRPGDRVAILLKNTIEFPIVFWAVQRSGTVAPMLSTHLKPEEAAYIVKDSGAKLLITSADLGETAQALAARRAELIPTVEAVYNAGAEPLPGAIPLRDAIADLPTTPIPDEISGYYMMYSSGTTGRPKGIVLPFTVGAIEALSPNEAALIPRLGKVSLTPGPLYHAAPLMEMMAAHRVGALALSNRKFDPERTLAAIARYRVERAWFVPTMFVRMLALPDAVRAKYDLSSLKLVEHAAAPCPVEVKRRMIDWFGPIIGEYYSSSEAAGATYITSEEWLRKPGSVGKAMYGVIHICGDDGEELPVGEAGAIYFESPGARFQYLNDPEKTARTRHPRHPDWYAVGDIGRLDEDGYLFLTDRKDFMIISGGVNIYPQAVEDALIVHPKVLDAAVIGVPDPEYGEAVKAVVQPKDWPDAGPALAEDLIAWCKARISAVSCPRTVEFVEDLPRIPSGKLAKHELKRLYGGG